AGRVEDAAHAAGPARGHLRVAGLDVDGQPLAVGDVAALHDDDAAGQGDDLGGGRVAGGPRPHGPLLGDVVDAALGLQPLGGAAAVALLAGIDADDLGPQAGAGLQGLGVAAPDGQALAVDDLRLVSGDVDRGAGVAGELRLGARRR